ncbi:hypothetical protein SAMN05192541_131105 [Bradyrhizobium arachidis]|nr:hypothetical protein SAMN05192541_131105 [Bradyrhizobium arachidis]
MLRESQVRLAGDFVGGSKFGTISRKRRRRIVVRGQLAVALDYYEDQIPIGCSNRRRVNFLR